MGIGPGNEACAQDGAKYSKPKGLRYLGLCTQAVDKPFVFFVSLGQSGISGLRLACQDVPDCPVTRSILHDSRGKGRLDLLILASLP